MARSLSGSRDDEPTTRRRRTSVDVDAARQGGPADDGDDYADEQDDLGEETRPTTRRRTSREDSDTGTSRRSAVQRPTMRDTKSRDKTPANRASAIGTGGFAAYKKASRERSQEYPRLEVDDQPQLLKFAEPEPFALIFRHWVPTERGRRPWTCLGDDCPLCDVGDQAKEVLFFNVITVADASLKVWEASKDPARQIQKRYDDSASSPLDRDDLYFAVSKAQKSNKTYEYTLEKVKVRDLEEDFDAEPLTDEEIDEATKKLYDDSIIKVPTKADLREAVKGLED